MRIALLALVIACGGPPAVREDHPLPTTNVGTAQPYWKELARGARASLGERAPGATMCLTLRADGHVTAARIGKSTSELHGFVDARNQHPQPVPPELRSALDGWVCMPLPAIENDELR